MMSAGQLAQMGERGVAGAEVVDGQLDAEIAQLGQPVADQPGVLHQHPLAHLDGERARRQAALRERGRHLGGELRGVQLPQADVHRHPTSHEASRQAAPCAQALRSTHSPSAR